MNEPKGQECEYVGEDKMESLDGVCIVQATNPVITGWNVLLRILKKTKELDGR